MSGRLPLHHAVVTAIGALRLTDFPYLYTPPDPQEARRRRPNSLVCRLPMIDFLSVLVNAFPEGLERRCGITGLYPFMLASAEAVENSASCVSSTSEPNSYDTETSCASATSASTSMSSTSTSHSICNKSRSASTCWMRDECAALSIVYFLLRENPSLVGVGIPNHGAIIVPDAS